MVKIYTPKTAYSRKDSPYRDQIIGQPGFMLTEEGGFLLQENEAKIVVRESPNFDPNQPYAPRTSPYARR